MNWRFTYSLISWIVPSGFLVLFISSCDSCSATPDYHDKTPPTIEWIINHPTGEPDTITGSGLTAVSMGDGINVMAVVKDEGGINAVQTSRLSGYDCLGESLQQPSFGPYQQSMPLGVGSDGRALTLFPIGFDVNTFFVCPTGLTFQQGNIILKCSGTNFNNLTTESTLTIHVNKKF